MGQGWLEATSIMPVICPCAGFRGLSITRTVQPIGNVTVKLRAKNQNSGHLCC